MSRVAHQPLSPQHTGGSILSTLSQTTNATWVSSVTSYPPSAGFEETRGRSAWRGGKEMVSTREYRTERPTMSKKSSSGNNVSLSLLSKKPSNSSLASPGFDLAYNNMISPPPSAFSTKSSSFSQQTKVKIKPLLRKISSQESQSVDLSRSAAENEGLGIFTNSGYTGAVGPRKAFHTRTSSAVSQVSTTTSSSGHRAGTQYIHPMRQTPQSYTPPLARSRSRANSDEEHLNVEYSQPTLYGSSHQSYAPLPTSKRTPPPLHIRTHSNHSNSRVNSSSQGNLNNIPGTPSSLRQASEPFSPESMPLTARSSLESAFRKRSRNNTINDDPYAYVQQLRADFAAKEAAKDQKYAEAQARAAEKEARRQERRTESQRRKEDNAERKRARSRGNSEKDVQLSAIGYERTAPGLPVDEELEYIRRGKRPPARVIRTGTQTSSVSKKAKAAASSWSLFVFNLKTMWLKFKRAMGRKARN